MDTKHNNCNCIPEIGCDVYNCKYNDNSCSACTAEHIKVENKYALKKGETYCGTFAPRTSF